LKKKISQVWNEFYYQAFEEFKNKLFLFPMLKFPEFDKAFEVYMHASDFAIGRVFIQDARPIAYKSRKMDSFQKRWPIHKMNLFIVVHCLKT
jgi:hypothetical protein